MRKQLFIRSLQIKLLMIAFTIPYFTNSQNATDTNAKKPLNIGFVLYTKGNTPGTLFARWNYANKSSGPGLATGGPHTDGYAGNYHVRYFYESGKFSDEYDLVIEKAGDFYDVSWIINEKVAAKGVGMEVSDGLAVGWRRVTD
ncbi:hypothetical protein [Aestuariivivens sediminicola]|uniref:hypothetical protein n=1 Tax=Aestuariivivens sediminicola TaxID=2913560 RepID=UPI001F581165|nr:hypothetical protein [Aestuariivivens sediminicola]